MQIVDFAAAHVEQAAHIAKQNYEEERGLVPALPPIENVPDLTRFAQNGLGVAAFEGGEMVGFLCALKPWVNAWDNPRLNHVFSPMGANGTVPQNRAKIYARLYQAAGEKWAKAGAASHGVCLYAHDAEGQAQFFRYGFGMRCVDAIREMEPTACPPCEGYAFAELAPEEVPAVYPLDLLLNRPQRESPFFMNRKPSTPESFVSLYARQSSRFFGARHKGKLCAYMKILSDGETFITGYPDYIHIGGAYCLPEHRGRGVYQNLLNLVLLTLRNEGITRLGVDFESFNPTAYGFWLKYFDAYTHSVVRRIDERAIQ